MDSSQVLEGLVALDKESATALGAYVVACIFGQLCNAVWMWLGKEIDCVMDRFKDDPRATIKSCIANLGVILGIAAVMPWAGVPLKAAILMGLLQGAYSDSKLNKSARPVWTPEQRQAAAVTEAGK